MYTIENYGDYLMVRFEEDFDMNTIRALIHHEMTMNEFLTTNDIWMVGSCRACIRLGELDEMAENFQCHCPKTSTRTKTAVVAERGLTQAIFDLWISAVREKVSFDIMLFYSLEDAKEWLGVSHTLVA